MTQLSIDFDTPLARTCDPVTSLAAAADTIPRLRELHRRLLVSVALFEGDFTAMEAASAAHDMFPAASAETYRKRCAELERAGLIRQHSIRCCRITRKPARAFVLA